MQYNLSMQLEREKKAFGKQAWDSSLIPLLVLKYVARLSAKSIDYVKGWEIWETENGFSSFCKEQKEVLMKKSLENSVMDSWNWWPWFHRGTNLDANIFPWWYQQLSSYIKKGRELRWSRGEDLPARGYRRMMIQLSTLIWEWSKIK